MTTWQRTRHRTPRYTADWRWREATGPWATSKVHALPHLGSLMTGCGRPVPADARPTGYGAVTCPRCRGIG